MEVGSTGRAAGEPASEQRTMDELAAVDLQSTGGENPRGGRGARSRRMRLSGSQSTARGENGLKATDQ